MPVSSRSITLLTVFRIVLVVAMFVAAFVLYPNLPAIVPTHWNFRGEADGFSSRLFGAFLLPCIGVVFLVLFPVLRRLDPKAENYAAFRTTWEWIQTAILGFMTYVFVVQMVATLRPAQSAMVGQYIVFGVGVLFVLLGNFMGKIRQNYFVGLRTPWSLADPEVWQKSQRIAGYAFVLGGIAIVVQSLFPGPSPAFFFGTVLLMVALPVLYSYLAFRRRRAATALILAGLAITLLTVAVARLASPEDDWRCERGQWTAHGTPSSPMPSLPCL